MADPQLLNQILSNNAPYCKAMGIRAVHAADGQAVMTLDYHERLIGDPATGVLHGGAVSALLDTACGLAVLTDEKAGGITATIDLRIAYMRPAKPGSDITARADVFNVTRSVAFVRAIAWDTDEEKPVATATGSFTNMETRTGAGK